MDTIEMQSGSIFEENKINEISNAVIRVLSEYDLLVCDAKEILKITENKIDRAIKLQASP